MDIINLTLESAINGLEKNKFSSLELVKSYLDRIKKFNSKYNAFITVNPMAIEQAKNADKLRKKGIKKPLLGIPIALKDNFLIKGMAKDSID